MKSPSVALKAHFQQEVTSLCTCWKATLVNGDVYGFTDHTRNIRFQSVDYLASSGYTPTAVATSGKLDVDNLDIEGLLSSDLITDGDLIAGLWDFAEIEIFQINYNDLTMGSMQLRKGWLGEVNARKSVFTAELRGMTQKLQQTIGRIFTPSCDATLGDTRCKKDLTTFTFSGTVQTVTSQRQFLDASLVNADAYFDYGLVQWLTGTNAGLTMEVKTYTVGNVLMQLPMAYAIEVGDTYNIIAGCNKILLGDCKTKFNNVINFRGFDSVPGNDNLMKGPE